MGRKRKASKLISLGDAAELLGVSKATVANYRNRGMPAVKRKRLYFYDPAKITAWATKHKPTKSTFGPRRKPDPDDDQDESDLKALTATELQDELARAKLLEIRARTAKHEHELEVKRGEVVPRDEVKAERLKRIAAVKAGLLGLKSKLPAVLVGLGESEIAALLEREVNELLERFAGARS